MSLFGRVAGSFLPDRDYVSLAMPTTDLEPLRVLHREGDVLRRYGRLRDVLTASADLPVEALERDATVANAGGGVKGAAQVNVFGGLLLQALGGPADLDLSAAGGHDVEYRYEGLASDAVHVTALDAWLSRARLARGVGRETADLLVSGRLYVVVAVLKAAGMAASMRDERGGHLTADVPALQGLVGAGVKVEASAERTSMVSFSGSEPLVIAAKAARLNVDAGGFRVGAGLARVAEIRGVGGGIDYLRAAELVLA